MNRASAIPMLQAALAAILFGASAPIAKLLLGEISPIPLAGLLYLGSGIALVLLSQLRSIFQGSVVKEAPINRHDLLFLSALPLILISIALLFREDHSHAHVHLEVEHEHCHDHAELHHQHQHASGLPANMSHSHVHRHDRIEQDHCHMPDIHHRHVHA